MVVPPSGPYERLGRWLTLAPPRTSSAPILAGQGCLDPIVESKVELQQLAGAGDGPMFRLAGGWPTQLCGCRVQPARQCPL